MNYIEETATEGEVVIGTATFSWLFLALEMVPFWLILLGLGIGFEILVRTPAFQKYIPGWLSEYGILILVLVGIWRYLSGALPWVYTEIAATNRRVVYRHGFFTRQVEEVAINRIEGVNMSQSLLGRIFGFGSVTIAGVGVEEVRLPPIAQPMHFRKAIQEAINESQSRDARFN
jgi:uncharacterized membrane protein YdbT with pleckstrin-like domain